MDYQKVVYQVEPENEEQENLLRKLLESNGFTWTYKD